MLRQSRLLKIYTDCCKGRTILEIPSTISKVVCVARNYSDDASERTAPLDKRMRAASIFMKPPSSVASIEPTINIGGYQDVICETELALLIGKGLPRSASGVNGPEIIESISGLGIAFDLTRKELQAQLKAEGRPWELSKAFDNACPLSKFCKVSGGNWLKSRIDVQLNLNGELVLKQSTDEMILPVLELIKTITQHMSLWPGDVILTGTPTKPCLPPPIKPGDKLMATLGDYMKVHSVVV